MDSNLDQLPAATVGSAVQRPTAVVLDLFGTLVVAPDGRERAWAVREMATALHVPEPVADRALDGSWRARHDGTLRTTTDVAEHLAAECSAQTETVPRLESVLRRLAPMRLAADPTVLACLVELRRVGLRLGLLSDAAPDVVEAWNDSVLAVHFDVTLFSCREGAVKPTPSLYARVLERLGCAAHTVLYCGDGGGEELAGAQGFGMQTVRVERRGGPTALAFGACPSRWRGSALPSVESLPDWLRNSPCSREDVR